MVSWSKTRELVNLNRNRKYLKVFTKYPSDPYTRTGSHHSFSLRNIHSTNPKQSKLVWCKNDNLVDSVEDANLSGTVSLSMNVRFAHRAASASNLEIQ